MSKRKNLTGNEYDELTVLGFSHSDPETGSPLWLCRCSCGAEKAIHGYALEHGHYKSCGCKHAEKRDAGVKKHIEQDSIDGTRKSALKAKLHKSNKSGYKGVRWNEQRRKWTAHIGFKGKQISLGYFTNKDDAIAARKAGEEKYHMPYIDKSDPSN